MANLNSPEITGVDNTVKIGESILISDFFSVFDPDGDEIIEYSFFDANDAANSGYLTLNGVKLAAGMFHTIDAQDLANVRFVAGTVVGEDLIRIRANDGIFNSNTGVALGFTVRENTTAPIFTTRDMQSVANEFIPVRSFFSGYDPDGWPTVRYKFRDQNAKSNSGYFVLDGVRQASNAWFYVKAEDYSKLEYFTGTTQTQENLLGRMFDGEKWSDVARSKFVTTPNMYRPVVQPLYIAKSSSEEFQISEMFNVTDRDGNKPKWYEFRDSSLQSNSGFITINGVVQPAATWLRVQADNLVNTTFTTGSVNRLDNISVRVFDGRHVSFVKRAFVAVATKPVVDPKPPLVFDGDETVQLVSIIDQSDDGPRNIRYRIYDDSINPFSARFELDANVLAPKRTHVFDAATMDRVFLKSGDFTDRRLDEIFVQTFNGVKWSVWRSLKVQTEPRMLDAIANVEDDVIANRNSWRQFIGGSADEPLRITYSFQERAEPTVGFFSGRLTNAERIEVRKVLDRLEHMLFIDFVEIADNYVDPLTFNEGGIIRIGHGPGFAFNPEETAASPWGGNILISQNPMEQLAVGTAHHAEFLALLGNALGLREANSTSQYFNPLLFKWPLPSSTDDQRNTVMSFNYNPDNVVLDIDGMPTGGIIPVDRDRYGIYDMNALLHLYGPAPGSFAGDDTYGNTGNPTDLFDWSEKVVGMFEHIEINTPGPDNTIRLEAIAAGNTTPPITITFDYTGLPNVVEDVTVVGNDITVVLETDADGNILSTGNSVVAAINASPANAFVNAINKPGDPGTGVIGGAFATTALTLLHDRAFQTSIVGDTGGEDTIDASAMFVSSVIDLTPGSYSSIGEISTNLIDFYPATNNVAIGRRSIIENAIGGVSDELIRGNFTDNILIGNEGDDILIGGGGSDQLFGGPGNDTYRWKLTDQNETIDENLGGGLDILELNSHWAMNSIRQDMTFARDGRDLIIDLNFNGGLSQGQITLKDQTTGLSRVEILRLNYVNGTSVDVDVRSIFTSATTTPQNFELTMDSTEYGFIAAPV